MSSGPKRSGAQAMHLLEGGAHCGSFRSGQDDKARGVAFLCDCLGLFTDSGQALRDNEWYPSRGRTQPASLLPWNPFL